MEKMFVSNNGLEGRKVLTTIENELSKCTSFSMSVAFITVGGLTPLLETLKSLEEKGVQGRILTTDYLLFSDPKALEKLDQFSNIDLRMYCCQEGEEAFHTKGYLSMIKKPGINFILCTWKMIVWHYLMMNLII